MALIPSPRYGVKGKRRVNHVEAGRKGGLATYAKHGSTHMSAIGKLGWQSTLESVAVRYPPPDGYTGGNFYRHLLANLKANK